jgi:hypothetical protein
LVCQLSDAPLIGLAEQRHWRQPLDELRRPATLRSHTSAQRRDQAYRVNRRGGLEEHDCQSKWGSARVVPCSGSCIADVRHGLSILTDRNRVTLGPRSSRSSSAIWSSTACDSWASSLSPLPYTRSACCDENSARQRSKLPRPRRMADQAVPLEERVTHSVLGCCRSGSLTGCRGWEMVGSPLPAGFSARQQRWLPFRVRTMPRCQHPPAQCRRRHSRPSIGHWGPVLSIAFCSSGYTLARIFQIRHVSRSDYTCTSRMRHTMDCVVFFGGGRRWNTFFPACPFADFESAVALRFWPVLGSMLTLDR